MVNKATLEYREKIENLKRYILKKEYGTTLTFNELNEFIGEDLRDEYGKTRFKSVIRKVKNKLYKQGYVLRSVNGIGYYILKPNQIASYTYRTFIIKPLNSFYKAQIILDCAEKDKLTNNEKKKHNKTIELNECLISATEQLIDDSDFRSLKEE